MKPWKKQTVFVTVTLNDLEAENRLSLVVDRPNRRELNRYRNARARQAMYRAAAKLWAQGVEISRAVEIVECAMKESGEL